MVVATKPTFRTDAFIDGAFQPAQSGQRFTTENPATGQPLAEVAAGDAADIDAGGPRGASGVRGRALVAARPGRSQGGAPALRGPARGQPRGARDARLARGAASRSPTAARWTCPDAIQTFRWYAEAIDKVFDAVAPTGPDALGLIVREPIGVVGAVVPWNFPLLMATWKLAPALAAGNSVIVKPAELTSL